jgi:hypothetical protein
MAMFHCAGKNYFSTNKKYILGFLEKNAYNPILFSYILG